MCGQRGGRAVESTDGRPTPPACCDIAQKQNLRGLYICGSPSPSTLCNHYIVADDDSPYSTNKTSGFLSLSLSTGHVVQQDHRTPSAQQKGLPPIDHQDPSQLANASLPHLSNRTTDFFFDSVNSFPTPSQLKSFPPSPVENATTTNAMSEDLRVRDG